MMKLSDYVDEIKESFNLNRQSIIDHEQHIRWSAERNNYNSVTEYYDTKMEELIESSIKSGFIYPDISTTEAMELLKS